MRSLRNRLSDLEHRFTAPVVITTPPAAARPFDEAGFAAMFRDRLASLPPGTGEVWANRLRHTLAGLNRSAGGAR